MKLTNKALIITLLFVGISDAQSPGPSSELLREYFTIARIARTAPLEIQESITIKVQQTVQSTQSPEQLLADITTLRTMLEESLPTAGRTVFDTTTGYTNTHGTLDAVWQALTYCGFACVAFLIIIAIQDNKARKIITKDEGVLDTLNKRHRAVTNAAHTTIEISRRLYELNAKRPAV
ncbi:MAG: hypothetical protein QG604_871 [Candidatus Dependentiae bacterium]|nr:hypothetical protein [Candidatus Dependentiae bacterium]